MRTCPKCYRKVSEQSQCDICQWNVVTKSYPEWVDVKEED